MDNKIITLPQEKSIKEKVKEKKDRLILEKEKWDVNIEKFQKEADEALGKYTEVLEQLESEQ